MDNTAATTRPDFLLVYIERPIGVSYADVEKRMDIAQSWYRINESLWILYTIGDTDTWFARLHPLLKDDGSVLICRLDVSKRQGWMNKYFWEWLRAREADGATAAEPATAAE